MVEEPLRIERASLGSWRELTGVVREVFSHLTPEQVSSIVRRDGVFACLDGHTVAGFYVFIPDATRPEVAWLDFIGVSEPYRRRGVGTMLLEHFEHEAAREGFTELELAVQRANQPAMTMYEERGWVPLPRPGEDATYRKALPARGRTRERVAAPGAAVLSVPRRLVRRIAYWMLVERVPPVSP